MARTKGAKRKRTRTPQNRGDGLKILSAQSLLVASPVGSRGPDKVSETEGFGRGVNYSGELLIVRVGHGGEAGSELGVVVADEAVLTAEVGDSEVIGYGHDVSDIVVGVEAASGICYHDQLHTQTPHHPDGQGTEVHRVTLVAVEPTAEADGLDALEHAEDQFTLVTLDGGHGEAWNFGVLEGLGFRHGLGQLREARAAYDSDLT